MDHRALALGVAALLAASAASARADVFLMKGGGRLTGDVVKQSKDDYGTKWVHVRTGFGTVRLQKKLIKKTVKAKRDKNVIRLTEVAVVALEGDVRVSRNDGATWQPLRVVPPDDATLADEQVPPRLGPGDRVKTAKDSRGEFDIGYGALHLEAEGEVVFNKAGASMAVLKGRSGVRVDESVPGKEFRVETPQASMGVRGTMFLVDVEGNATTVSVGEGQVAIGERVLDAGDAARVVADATPEDALLVDDAEDRFERLRRSFTFAPLEWIAVPAGKFAYGGGTRLTSVTSPVSGGPVDPGGSVQVQKLKLPAFLITRTELTVAEFRSARSWALRVGADKLVRSTVPSGSSPMTDVQARADGPPADDEPATLPWFDARAIAAAYGARLQSEAEWEYAYYARATTVFSWGDSPALSMEYERNVGNSGERAIAWDELTRMKPQEFAALGSHAQPVGTLRANKWGLHDMLSNVAEWCEDTDHPTLSGQPKDGSPRTTGAATTRMNRGHGVGTAFPFDPKMRRRALITQRHGVRLVRRIDQK